MENKGSVTKKEELVHTEFRVRPPMEEIKRELKEEEEEEKEERKEEEKEEHKHKVKEELEDEPEEELKEKQKERPEEESKDEPEEPKEESKEDSEEESEEEQKEEQKEEPKEEPKEEQKEGHVEEIKREDEVVEKPIEAQKEIVEEVRGEFKEESKEEFGEEEESKEGSKEEFIDDPIEKLKEELIEEPKEELKEESVKERGEESKQEPREELETEFLEEPRLVGREEDQKGFEMRQFETHEVYEGPEIIQELGKVEDMLVVKEEPQKPFHTIDPREETIITPVKETSEEQSSEAKPIEKPIIIISESKSPDNTERDEATEKSSEAKSTVMRSKYEDFVADMEIRRPVGLKPIDEEEGVSEIKEKEEEEKERNVESSASKVWSRESPMGSINFSLMDSDIISPGAGSLASGSISNPPELTYQEDLATPMGIPFLSALAERDLLASIKRIIISKQTEDVKEFREVKETGKIAWTKTHFIFILDCSGSMAGARWDSVVVGLFSCLKRIKRMVDVCVSAFTFDTKPNPFCRERTPRQAIANAERMPFTGKGTNYMRALEYAITLINKSKKDNHLLCILFLSDGLCEYPVEQIEKLKTMRKKGKKILFYTISCVTDEEKTMMKMATELQGEHYKVTNEEASRLVFSTILNV